MVIGNIYGKVGVLKVNTKMNDNNVKGLFSEDWIPVKQIVNGMIQTEDNQIVSGVKIFPKNIFIQENNRQASMISKLELFYNSIDYEFWLIIADRPVDINLYLSRLQILYNKTANSMTKKLILADINKGNMFMSSEYNVVDIEYYILFKEKRIEKVQKNIHNLISGLANAGLQASQTSNEDLRTILDNFLNNGEVTRFGTVM